MNCSSSFGVLKYLINKSKLEMAIHAIENLTRKIAYDASLRQNQGDVFEMFLFDEKLHENPPFIEKCNAILANSSRILTKLSNIKCSKRSIGSGVFDVLDQIFDHIDRQPASYCDLFCFTDGCDTYSKESTRKRLQHIQFRRNETNLCLYHIESANDGRRENVLEADKHIILKDNLDEIHLQVEALDAESERPQGEFTTVDNVRTRLRPTNNYASAPMVTSSVELATGCSEIDRRLESIDGQNKHAKIVTPAIESKPHIQTRRTPLKNGLRRP